MITPTLVEALLAGLVCQNEVAEAYPDLGVLSARAQAGGEGLSLQWALCVADAPLARGLLRHTASALLDLLDALDEGWEEGLADGCALWHVLQRAPAWLLRPSDPDDAEPDIALLLERDETYHGDWPALIEALHRAGSREWQWAIQRCRAMQAFEREQGVALRALLAPPAEEAPLRPGPQGEGAPPDEPCNLGLFITFDSQQEAR